MQDEVDVIILNAKNSFTSYMCVWLHHILCFFFTNTSIYVSYTVSYVQSIGPVTFIISCWFLQSSLFLLLLLFQSMGAGWQVKFSQTVFVDLFTRVCVNELSNNLVSIQEKVSLCSFILQISLLFQFNLRKSLFMFICFANKSRSCVCKQTCKNVMILVSQMN